MAIFLTWYRTFLKGKNGGLNLVLWHSVLFPLLRFITFEKPYSTVAFIFSNIFLEINLLIRIKKMRTTFFGCPPSKF